MKWRTALADFPKPPINKQLSTLNIKLNKEWDLKKNYPLKPDNYMATSKFKAWWKCSICNYSWQAVIYSRHVRGDGCSRCYSKIRAETIRKAKLRKGSIKDTHSEIVKYWDFEKNFPYKPEDFSHGSSKIVWWKCQLGHSYKNAINKKTNFPDRKCPKCEKENNSLIKKFPEIASQWHSTKNLDLPKKYSYGSNHVAWWICKKHNYIFKSSIKQRTRSDTKKRTDCKYCKIK